MFISAITPLLKPEKLNPSNQGLLYTPIKPAYNQSKYSSQGDLSVRDVAGIKQKSPFGIQYYNTPKFGEKN